MINRGANGEAPGEGNHLQLTHPNRRAEIGGVGNREISSTPVATDGGFACTAEREIIAMLHQCAC